MPCDYSYPNLPSAAAFASKLYASSTSTSTVSTGKEWVGSRVRVTGMQPPFLIWRAKKVKKLLIITLRRSTSKSLYRRCLLITNIIAPNRTHVTIRVDEVCC